MKKLGTYSTTFCLLALVFLALTSNVYSQDVFREIDRLKTELAGVKSEVKELKSLVLELRKQMVEYVLAPGRKARETPPQATEKKAAPVGEEQVTKVVCPAVGRFFAEAEAALRVPDTSEARSQMDKALRRMHSELREYDMTHRVSKLLNIYEGLAWSTYTAMQLADSIQGNRDFLKVLREHKQKYLETCPKQYQY